ncbi:MAG TPA: hypothetical protein VIH37_11985 [Candidatus Limnocylindrales bacterium]
MTTLPDVPAGTTSPDLADTASAAPSPGAARDDAPATAPSPHPTSLTLQILTTEHWSLLASRSLAWNESFSRAGMYLSTLSGAIVALGLVAGIDRFGQVFTVFALVILPLVLFVGLTTHMRMAAANYHDAITVHGMNRIRGAYAELVPGIEQYFVMSTHDDPAGMGVTMAVMPSRSPLLHMISATPFLLIVLNSAVAGAIAAVAAGALGMPPGPIIAIAAGVGAIMLIAQALSARRHMRRIQGLVTPRFPTPARNAPDLAPGDATAPPAEH